MIKNVNGKATVVGVFSWVADDKCAVKYPGVFMTVAKHLKWIKDTMETIINPPPPPPGNIFSKMNLISMNW